MVKLHRSVLVIITVCSLRRFTLRSGCGTTRLGFLRRQFHEDVRRPRMAVAIVKDGKIVVAKGYGVRKLGDPTPVDEHTMFGIGSNTKAFTTAALAGLVDAGKLSWDDPVYQRLPGFMMYDPYVSHEMTIRDLLTHRSGMGLGEGDLLFWPHSTYTRDEIVYKLRFHEAGVQLSQPLRL